MTMSSILRDYTEFIDAVLLFRYMRDTDKAPEAWLARRLSSLAVDGQENPDYYTTEVLEWLSFISKFAELIDDRKADLLEEIEADLRKVIRPASEDQVAA